MYTRDTTYTCDRALYTATTRRLVNLHLAQHLGIRQPVYVVFDDHPCQLTPGPLSHQTASPSSPAQCAGRCLLCSGPARHAHALVRHGHARTAVWARVRTSRARVAAVASTSQVVLGHHHVRQQKHNRHAHARAAGANGQPARGRHAPRYAPADARSAGRGRGLAALPRPSQCRPGNLNWLKIRTRWAARRRGPPHALWCCAQGRGAAACETRFGSAARGVQRAQQGAASSLPSRFYLCPIFRKARANWVNRPMRSPI